MNVRTGSNSCVAGINIISGTLITTPANNVGTNIEFLSGISSQGGDSYAGKCVDFQRPRVERLGPSLDERDQGRNHRIDHRVPDSDELEHALWFFRQREFGV